MNILQLDSFDTALEHLVNLAETRKFDMFRGQRRHWPLYPSMVRLEANARADALRSLTDFIEWAHSTPAMAPYAQSTDAIIAIAQHYGLGTHLLDWTYNPITALFFALVGSPSDSEHAAVFCARRDEVSGLKNSRLIELDVVNLWRLEAQEGFFVEVPDKEAASTLENHCQIVTFPKPETTPFDRTAYYPPRKSDLEIKVDQFLQRDAVIPALEKLTEEVAYVHLSRWHTYPGAFFGRTPLSQNTQWETQLNRWMLIQVESLDSLSSLTLLEIGELLDGPPTEQFSNLRNQFLESKEVSGRAGAMTFSLNWTNIDRERITHAEKTLSTYWDGIRRLPFPIEAIADGLAALSLCLFNFLKNDTDAEATFSQLFGEVVTVEFADLNGLHQAGPVSKEGLAGVISQEALDGLTPYVRRRAQEKPEDLFCFVLSPSDICDLDRFAALMAREVVVGQIAWNFIAALTNEDWDTVFEAPSYDPTNLAYFGTTRFRFDFPFANDPQPEDTIFLFEDMEEDEIAAEVLSAGIAHHSGVNPAFFLRLSGWLQDPRELHENEEAVEILRQFAVYGGMSLLEIHSKDPVILEKKFEQSSPPTSAPFGAFHVWCIVNRCVVTDPNISKKAIGELFEKFRKDLHKSNKILDEAIQAHVLQT